MPLPTAEHQYRTPSRLEPDWPNKQRAGFSQNRMSNSYSMQLCSALLDGAL